MDMNDIFFVVALAILATRSKPIILAKRYMGIKDEDFDRYRPGKQLLVELLSCMWCLSFWLGLFMGGFKVAVISSGLAFLIDENF